MENLFSKLFKDSKIIIGMLHILNGNKSVDEITEDVLNDLYIYKGRVHGAIVENYGWGGGNSYRANPRVEEILTKVTKAAVTAAGSNFVIGVNVLPNDYKMAFRIARNTGAEFIQLDYVAGAYEGSDLTEWDDFMKERERCADIAVLGGIYPKYYRPTKESPSFIRSAFDAMDRADAIVITGEKTGGEANQRDIETLNRYPELKPFPKIIGSGMTATNLRLLDGVRGAIVGSYFKTDGKVNFGSRVEEGRVEKFMEALTRRFTL